MSSSLKNLWSEVKGKINKSGKTSLFKGPTTSQLFGTNPPAILRKSALAKKIQSQIISDKAAASAEAEAFFKKIVQIKPKDTKAIRTLFETRVGGYKKTRKNKKRTKHYISSRKHRK